MQARPLPLILSDNTTLATLELGIEPECVAISQGGRWLCVTSETTNSVSMIDTNSDSVEANHLVDVPQAAAWLPDYSRAYVSSEISGSPTDIDGRSQELISTIPIDNGSVKRLLATPRAAARSVLVVSPDLIGGLRIASELIRAAAGDGGAS